MKIFCGFQYSQIETDCEIPQKLDDAKIFRYTVRKNMKLKMKWNQYMCSCPQRFLLNTIWTVLHFGWHMSSKSFRHENPYETMWYVEWKWMNFALAHETLSIVRGKRDLRVMQPMLSGRAWIIRYKKHIIRSWRMFQWDFNLSRSMTKAAKYVHPTKTKISLRSLISTFVVCCLESIIPIGAYIRNLNS